MALALSGLCGESDTLSITIFIEDTPLAVDDASIPTEFKVHSALPNPFNNRVLLKWDIPF